MPIVITSASGHLGRLVVQQLVATGTRPARLVAAGRDIHKLADFAGVGVTVRAADIFDPTTPNDVFAARKDLVKFIRRLATTAREAVQNAATNEASR